MAESLSYRYWARKNRLFLNFLNEIPNHPLGFRDQLSLKVLCKRDEDLYHFDFLNSIRDEFTFSRYLFFEGKDLKIHYSDEHVNMVGFSNNVQYGYSIQCIRSSLKTAYEIFDKIAFF